MTLTLKVPESTVIDWKYVTDNLTDLKADDTVKTE